MTFYLLYSGLESGYLLQLLLRLRRKCLQQTKITSNSFTRPQVSCFTELLIHVLKLNLLQPDLILNSF